VRLLERMVKSGVDGRDDDGAEMLLMRTVVTVHLERSDGRILQIG